MPSSRKPRFERPPIVSSPGPHRSRRMWNRGDGSPTLQLMDCGLRMYSPISLALAVMGNAFARPSNGRTISTFSVDGGIISSAIVAPSFPLCIFKISCGINSTRNPASRAIRIKFCASLQAARSARMFCFPLSCSMHHSSKTWAPIPLGGDPVSACPSL